MIVLVGLSYRLHLAWRIGQRLGEKAGENPKLPTTIHFNRLFRINEVRTFTLLRRRPTRYHTYKVRVGPKRVLMEVGFKLQGSSRKIRGEDWNACYTNIALKHVPPSQRPRFTGLYFLQN